MGARRGGKLTTACREGAVNLLHYICQVRAAVVGVQQLIWTHTHEHAHTHRHRHRLSFSFCKQTRLVPHQGENPPVERWCKVLFDHCVATKVRANAGLCIVFTALERQSLTCVFSEQPSIMNVGRRNSIYPQIHVRLRHTQTRTPRRKQKWSPLLKDNYSAWHPFEHLKMNRASQHRHGDSRAWREKSCCFGHRKIFQNLSWRLANISFA